MRWLAMLIALLPASAFAQDTLVADFNFLLGNKQVDTGDWGKTLDEQFTTGLETTWRHTRWPVGIAADAMFANAEKRRNEFTQDETLTRASTLELAVGARAIVPFGAWRPHLGAGVELAQGDVQVIRRGDADDAAGAGGTGVWVSGGVFARLGRTANIGMSVRWSQANVKSSTFEADAGGIVYGVTLGFGIPPYDPNPDPDPG
jgi:hypothetical protein